MAVPGWLTIVSWVFIGAGLLSAALIVADIYLLGYREHVKIMEAVWPLTALYAGPAGLLAYARWGRPMSHKWMTARGRGMPGRPFWAGTAVSATHCGAGCVLGDLIAEWVVFAAGMTLAGFALPVEYPFDYVMALSWGILFQYFVIVPMRHLAAGEGLKLAAKADFLALSAFEVGLFGWMAIMQLVLFTAPHLSNRHGGVLVPDAGGHAHRVCHHLPGELVAHPARHQGRHVSPAGSRSRRGHSRQTGT